MLDFKNFKFLTVEAVKKVELHQCAKFHRTVAEIWCFWIFKMVAAAIVDFRNFEYLTVGRVTSVKLRHHAKFRRNRSNRGRHM